MKTEKDGKPFLVLNNRPNPQGALHPYPTYIVGYSLVKSTEGVNSMDPIGNNLSHNCAVDV